MRSKLFVPGTQPQRFATALASGADAVSFDLEDAVPADAKAEARAQVAAFVHSVAAHATPAWLIVRCNAPGTTEFERDVAAIAGSAARWLNLPKIHSAEQLRAAVEQIERAEAGAGAAQPMQLLVNIETPKALRCAAEIALAHPRIAALQLGLGDLFEPAAIRRDDLASVHAAMFALRLAAAEAGVAAIDGAWPGLDDADGFMAEARLARALGFAGKSCIHPKQIAWAHAVFAPGADELAFARRVIDAAAVAQAEGRGAFVVDGRMIDTPYLHRARALLAAAASTTPTSE
ncbi:CoA ester lyase [Aquincola sp. S2]|uniref:CoA ester lyase n=1 Tax=Pseudaquabacterium terrae TaxID=2732868 RepID=A0ABX2E9X3_9BURK|nr:CoA ester lyase [Aquabacterium terrae]NRF65826.1 CoA ester lyase [Aquabacterium terrae]